MGSQSYGLSDDWGTLETGHKRIASLPDRRRVMGAQIQIETLILATSAQSHPLESGHDVRVKVPVKCHLQPGRFHFDHLASDGHQFTVIAQPLGRESRAVHDDVESSLEVLQVFHVFLKDSSAIAEELIRGPWEEQVEFGDQGLEEGSVFPVAKVNLLRGGGRPVDGENRLQQWITDHRGVRVGEDVAGELTNSSLWGLRSPPDGVVVLESVPNPFLRDFLGRTGETCARTKDSSSHGAIIGKDWVITASDA